LRYGWQYQKNLAPRKKRGFFCSSFIAALPGPKTIPTCTKNFYLVYFYLILETQNTFLARTKNQPNNGKENEMEYSHVNPEEIFYTIGPAIVIFIALFVLALSAAILIIKAVIFCRIFSKAGYHWALGLLMLVPIACIIMPFILAFGQWPIYGELQQLRRQQNKCSP